MSDTTRFIVKRLMLGVLVVLCVTVLIFAIMQAMPGDAIEMVTDVRVSQDKLNEIKARWGLDRHPVIQYFYWLKNILSGDFGTSITTGQPVSILIGQRLPYTLMLTIAALAVEYLVAIPMGLYAAVRKDRLPDKIMMVVMIVLWSMPAFWLGVLFILRFSIWFEWFPISGYSGAASLVLPALTLALPQLAQIFRLTRSEVLDVMSENYVTTAYAKGLMERRILRRHVLRNALIPVTVMFFLSLPWLIGGSVVVENVFAWPGMGQLLWKGIAKQDFPIVQGIIFVIAILTVVCNIIGDIVAGILDPRIRLE